MNRVFQKIAGIVIISWCSIPAIAQESFRPPEIVSAGAVQAPNGSTAVGIIVLDVSLDSDGQITNIDVPSPIASLTSAAISAVKSWKFKPASLGGTACPGVLRIAFAFRPMVIFNTPSGFVPLVEPEDQSSERRSSYIAPGITAVDFPSYPINAANAAGVGVIVMQVELDGKGKLGDVKVILGFNPFTTFALEVVKRWNFLPALYGGSSSPSSVAVAFVVTPINAAFY